MKRITMLATAAAALLAFSPAPAATTGLWLHVAVDEQGEGGDVVRVNLPIELVTKILPLVHHENLSGGKIKIDTGDEHMKAADLRAVLDAVRTSRDGEYVTVDGPREKVRVAKRGGFLLVQAAESGEKPHTVEMKVPLAVVDALLAGTQDDELNVSAAIEALARQGTGDIVTVHDDGSHVRIWIDAEESAK